MASLARLYSSKPALGAAIEAFFADRDLAPATRRAFNEDERCKSDPIYIFVSEATPVSDQA